MPEQPRVSTRASSMIPSLTFRVSLQQPCWGALAFVLLAYLGWNMIGEAKEACDIRKSYTTKEMFVLAIATSIDALAVGVSFAFLQTDIWLAVALIAIVTFAISTFGGLMGFKLGSAVGKNANICGGAVLICIGLKILLEHTGIL